VNNNEFVEEKDFEFTNIYKIAIQELAQAHCLNGIIFTLLEQVSMLKPP
jgi:hypothetical protein